MPGLPAESPTRCIAATLLFVAVLAADAGSLGVAQAAPSSGSAVAAGRLSESIRLRLSRKSGSTFVHSGRASGSVAGSVRSTLRLNSLSIRGTATIKNRRGTLRLQINGRARSGGTRARFSGSARVSGGTGAYRRARGSGSFSGIVDRRTWAASIKATGSLRY